MNKQLEPTTNPGWPVGRVATRIVLFTRERNSVLEKLLNLMHATVNIINPNDAPLFAAEHDIKNIPTILFFYNDHEINRLEG